VLVHLRRVVSADAAIHLVGVELGLTVLLGASLGLAAVPPSQNARLAQITGGQVSPQAFQRLTAAMDPAMLALAVRYEKNAPLASWGAPPADPSLAQVNDDPAAADQADGAPVIKLQDLSPDAARIWNATNPVSTEPNAAAKPFKLNAGGVMDEARAVDCMTAAIYYEAAVESTDGQRAVAQVVLNRMRHPAFPKTVCGVVFQGSNRTTGCQFSFTCDGSLGRTPSQTGWARARQVAVAALNGYVMKQVGNATHYHANYVAPYWSPSLVKIGAIGAHIFYRWTGSWGLPPAFSGRYGGGEMDGLRIATLDNLAQIPAGLASKPADTLTAPAPEAMAVEVATVTPRRAAADPSAPPTATSALDDAEVLTAAGAAKDAGAITKPEDLDWAGRPKQKGPPRVAMPRAMF
jgi:spore germination cell wall hydrolase CwlJ-like protein